MTRKLSPRDLIFGLVSPAFPDDKLETVAEVLVQRIAEYASVNQTQRSIRTIVQRIEGFITDLNTLHPVTRRPMIEHRHLLNEAIRLLELVRDIRAVPVGAPVDAALLDRLATVARDSRFAAKGQAARRAGSNDWRQAIINKANALTRESSRLKTAGIARKIAPDHEANPAGKSEETIRNLLNEGKIR